MYLSDLSDMMATHRKRYSQTRVMYASKLSLPPAAPPAEGACVMTSLSDARSRYLRGGRGGDDGGDDDGEDDGGDDDGGDDGGDDDGDDDEWCAPPPPLPPEHSRPSPAAVRRRPPPSEVHAAGRAGAGMVRGQGWCGDGAGVVRGWCRDWRGGWRGGLARGMGGDADE